MNLSKIHHIAIIVSDYEAATLMTHEGENSFIYKSRAGKPTVLTMG